MNLQESIRADLNKIFSERSEHIVENDLDEPATNHEAEMLDNQVAFIKYASDEICNHVKNGGVFPEWFQNKFSGVHEKLKTLHAYMEGERQVDTDITSQGRRDESINEASESTSEDDMIELLNNKFPGCKAVSTEEWDGRAGGIWFRGTESCEINDMPVFNQEIFIDTMGVNPALDKLLTRHGWYGEPYDSGTLMAYPV